MRKPMNSRLEVGDNKDVALRRPPEVVAAGVALIEGLELLYLARLGQFEEGNGHLGRVVRGDVGESVALGFPRKTGH